jgi:hypothetical protein
MHLILVMMKRYFYYYKPTLWERTMKVASMRKARRKHQQFQENCINGSELKNLTSPQNNSESNQKTKRPTGSK